MNVSKPLRVARASIDGAGEESLCEEIVNILQSQATAVFVRTTILKKNEVNTEITITKNYYVGADCVNLHAIK